MGRLDNISGDVTDAYVDLCEENLEYFLVFKSALDRAVLLSNQMARCEFLQTSNTQTSIKGILMRTLLAGYAVIKGLSLLVTIIYIPYSVIYILRFFASLKPSRELLNIKKQKLLSFK